MWSVIGHAWAQPICDTGQGKNNEVVFTAHYEPFLPRHCPHVKRDSVKQENE